MPKGPYGDNMVLWRMVWDHRGPIKPTQKGGTVSMGPLGPAGAANPRIPHAVRCCGARATTEHNNIR